jgi:hypothetical protein
VGFNSGSATVLAGEAAGTFAVGVGSGGNCIGLAAGATEATGAGGASGAGLADAQDVADVQGAAHSHERRGALPA